MIDSVRFQPAASRLRVILIPGLFSPRWLMRPMGRFLRNRFSDVTVYDHPHWLGNLDGNREALSAYFASLDHQRPTALVAHSFGDWLSRDLIHQCGAQRPSHLVSIAPVVTTNIASKLAGKVFGDSIGEISVMRDREQAELHLALPPTIRHLVIWPTVDPWIRRIELPSPQTIEDSIFGSHNSAALQPAVMHRVAQFLSCQSIPQRPVSMRSPETAARAVYARNVCVRNVCVDAATTHAAASKTIDAALAKSGSIGEPVCH